MTSTFLPVGYVTPPGQDVLPSTGPHLDVRVMKDGKYIDPGTIRSLLTRLKVGDKKTPLWQQKGEAWNPSFPITSGYGARSAPTAGASTFHPAHDYGVPEKTALSWEGPGTFTPGKGYGEIKTTGSGGEEYLIKLLHTMGGKPGGAAAPATQQSVPAATAQPTENITYNLFLDPNQVRKRDPYDFLKSYSSRSSLLSPQELLAIAMPNTGSDPVAAMTRALNAQPNFS